MDQKPGRDARRPPADQERPGFTRGRTLVRQDSPDDADPEQEARDDPGTPGG